MATILGLTLLVLFVLQQQADGIIHRPPPDKVPIGAEWLNTMPRGQDWTPPANPPQPVVEVHFRTCKPGVQVVEYLYAEVRPANLGRGTATDAAIRVWTRSIGTRNDDAGHIIGRNQGGLGTVQWNIFPQNPNFNRGTYAQDVERMINDAVKRYGLVQIWFRFQYLNSALPCRPSSFDYFMLSPNFILNDNLENPVSVFYGFNKAVDVALIADEVQ